MQELESVAHRTASWEVLQRGGVALSDMWDEYKSTGDAASYAKTMRNVFFSIAGPLLQSRLALSDAKTKVCLLATPSLLRPWRLWLLPSWLGISFQYDLASTAVHCYKRVPASAGTILEPHESMRTCCLHGKR